MNVTSSNFVDRLGIAKAVKRENEQTLLDVQAHQPRRHIQAHQSGMYSSRPISAVKSVALLVTST
jgi:hypothetical protein